MSSPLKHLVELVCSVYREDGFEPLPTGKDVKPRLWPRPPLYTELTLLGEPLQQFVEVKTELDIDSLVDTYEQFVAGYLVTNEFRGIDSAKWLRHELRLRGEDARMLFAPALGMRADQRPHYLTNLTQFAALVSYNFDCSVLHTYDAFIVTEKASGFQFGVREGAFVSNLNCKDQFGLRLPASNGRLLLHSLQRSEARRRRMLTVHDRLAYWAEFQPQMKALHLALGVLWWRNSNTAAMLERIFKKEKIEVRPSTAADVARARDALDSSSPLVELRQIFVPKHMPINEFIEKFSNPYRTVKLPLSKIMRRKLELALDELTQ